MAKGGRSGCLRAFLGGVFGGIAGAVLAIVIGMIDAPEVDPADELAFEWYTPFALFVLPTFGLIGGAVLGMFAASACERAGGRAVGWGLAGLVLGLAAGKVLDRGQGDGAILILHLALTGAFAVVGLMLALRGTEKRRLPTDDWSD